MEAIAYIAMVVTVGSMFLIGRTGLDQKRGLWLNTGAGVLWIACGVCLGSWPLVLQSAAIMGFNLLNLRRLSRDPA